MQIEYNLKDWKSILFLFLIFIFLCACNRTDFSNPENVIKHYRELIANKEYELTYDNYLSISSRELLPKGEYLKIRQEGGSIKIINSAISELSTGDSYNPNYKRFKEFETMILKNDTDISKNDTLKRLSYYTLKNENGEWKIIFTESLLLFAQNKFNDGNYSEARKTLDKVIEIDPYSGKAYDLLAWTYLRDESIPATERENGTVKNAKYALDLEIDNPRHYNTFCAYYSSKNDVNLATDYLERGLKYCLNKRDKVITLLNISSQYTHINNFYKAEDCLRRAALVDSNVTGIWFNYGEIFRLQSNYHEAIKYYKKALALPVMEKYLQGNLYGAYAECSLNTNDCVVAKEYIEKALDIQPTRSDFQILYKRINNCSQ